MNDYMEQEQYFIRTGFSHVQLRSAELFFFFHPEVTISACKGFVSAVKVQNKSLATQSQQIRVESLT